MTAKLNTNLNFAQAGKEYVHAYTPGDDFYQELTELHSNLTDEQSLAVNAKLILLLANHIGDLDILRQAMTIAKKDLD